MRNNSLTGGVGISSHEARTWEMEDTAQFLVFSTSHWWPFQLIGGHCHRMSLTWQLQIMLFCWSIFVILTSDGDLFYLFVLHSSRTLGNLNILAITMQIKAEWIVCRLTKIVVPFPQPQISSPQSSPKPCIPTPHPWSTAIFKSQLVFLFNFHSKWKRNLMLKSKT